MTIYTKTMREALEEIEGNIIDGLLEGITLEATMSGAQISQLKKAFEPMRGKKISMASAEKLRKILDKVSDDKNALVQLYKANIPFVSRSAATRLISKHNMKGAEINKLAEEIALDEAKYDLYHKDFSSAMQHAYKMAKKLHGITISPDEISDKVATGPRKPSEGKTNKYRLKGDKGAIQVQVYNKGGSKPFELNMYKEEVELDENLQKAKKLMGPSKNREQGIEFVMKGLKISKQKATQMVDKILDEEVELDEGRMKELHGYIEQGMSAKEIAKKMKLDVKTIQALMPKKEEVEEGAAADARRAMRGDPDMKQRAFSKDDSATDDERKAASKNIMMQMRKAVSLRSFDVEFSDGKKVKIPQKVAQAVLQKYNSFRKPVDKEKYQAKVGKSYKDMLSALKEDIDEKKMTFGTKRIPAAMKKKGMDKVKTSGMAQDKSAGAYIGKMKKESTLERMNKKIQEKKNG